MRGKQTITWERLGDLGLHFVPSTEGPFRPEDFDAEHERVTHLFVIRRFETGKPPSVHLVTGSGVLDLDELREVNSLTGRALGMGWAERHRRPLSELSRYDRWRILHRDCRGRDGGVRPDEFERLRESPGTCGLSLLELNALRLIIDRFRGRGNNVEELLHDRGRPSEGDVEGYFGSRCSWLRSKTRRPSTLGERRLAMALAVLRVLRKLRFHVAFATLNIEDRLRRDFVVACAVGTATPPVVG
ncbi:hypothetical protein [Actinomadura sp. NPDC049753]|uniref:hypothetical protein n=1 Tax=Actinomadura sp. NPDC049753 TaxID=3154739 RepID=UPI00343FA3F5